jgi:hypothetical protein
MRLFKDKISEKLENDLTKLIDAYGTSNMYAPTAEEYEAGALSQKMQSKIFTVGAGIGAAVAVLSPLAMNAGLIGNLGNSANVLLGSSVAAIGGVLALWTKMMEKQHTSDAKYLREDGPSKAFEESVKNLLDKSEMSYNDDDITNLKNAVDARTKKNHKTTNNDEINLGVSRILKRMEM